MVLLGGPGDKPSVSSRVWLETQEKLGERESGVSTRTKVWEEFVQRESKDIQSDEDEGFCLFPYESVLSSSEG